MPIPVPGALSRLLAVRSLLDHPLTQRHSLDAALIHRLAGTPRCGDLTVRQVAEPPVLAEMGEAAAVGLPVSEDIGWRLGHSLGHALEQGVRLWLCEVPRQAPERIARILGEDLIHVVSLDRPDERGEPAPTVVVAVSPLHLVLALARRSEETREYLRVVLEGLDTLRCPRRAIVALRAAGVPVLERPPALRLILNPRFIAYVVIFVYSSLRALPVAFVPGFHGHWWVLWIIDIVTAVPYTWGLVEMVAGSRIRWRLTGLVTALVTFVIPYVYFWSQGEGYPRIVVVVIVAIILGSMLLETVRWLRDRTIVRGLKAPPSPGGA